MTSKTRRRMRQRPGAGASVGDTTASNDTVSETFDVSALPPTGDVTVPDETARTMVAALWVSLNTAIGRRLYQMDIGVWFVWGGIVFSAE